MKLKVLLTALFCLLLWPAGAYSAPKYGSNNGKYLTIRGTRIYYEEYGSGTPLLMLHGAFGSIRDFEKCIPQLAKRYRLIIPDAPGLGRSECADSALSYALLADYFSQMIDQLKLDSLYVLAWGDGGNAALLLAKNRPDKVKKLLVAGSNYSAAGFTPQGLAMRKQMADTAWAQREMKPWADNYQKISPNGNWKRYVSEAGQMWLQDTYFPLNDMAAIKAPVLLVYGDHDLVTMVQAQELQHAIPNSQLTILPGASDKVFNEKSKQVSLLAMVFFGR